MKKKSLLIVASLAYDGIETKENKVDNILGGAGTYICLSVKHFDNNCSIISVVGNDFKDHDLKLLESCGVDISGIKIEQNDKILDAFTGVFNNTHKYLNTMENNPERKEQEVLTARYTLGYQIEYCIRTTGSCNINCEY